MPIYEYECTKCGNQSEVWQKFSDMDQNKCELCGGRIKKLISHSSFHLKGTGWYVTDYASKSASKSPPKPGGAEVKSAKSDSKASSAKSEGATDTSKKKAASSE